ncbi:hypothetical protein K501DRAFT_276655 [Backusella circina FSU 941]|nr:hypothetical protein K501DRAFT_276655 [Backusella circina FSU 941]
MNYLGYAVLSKNTLENCHDFIFDRTKYIRQEFTRQNIRDITAIQVLEHIARFHITCLHEMQEFDKKKFSHHQGNKELREASRINKPFTMPGSPNNFVRYFNFIAKSRMSFLMKFLLKILFGNIHRSLNIRETIVYQKVTNNEIEPLFKLVEFKKNNKSFKDIVNSAD